MENDKIIAFQHSLIAAGYKPIKKEPLPSITQDLLDYVNSPEYQRLIQKERAKAEDIDHEVVLPKQIKNGI